MIHKLEWNEERLARIWKYYSETYPYKEQYFSRIVGEDIVRKTQRLIGSKPFRGVILDYGCGPGYLLYHIRKLRIPYSKYIGVDSSREAIERNKNIFIHDDKHIFLLEDDIEGFKNAIRADLCFLIEVLEHLDDYYISRALRNINELLKDEGVLIVTTPNEEDLRESMVLCPECGAEFHRMQHVRSWDKYTLIRTMEDNRFIARHVSKTFFITRKNIVLDALRRVFHILRGKRYRESHLFGVFCKLGNAP